MPSDAPGSPHAFLGNPVDVGRAIAHYAHGIGADVRDADVIAPDDQDVRLVLRKRDLRQRRAKQQESDSRVDQYFHVLLSRMSSKLDVSCTTEQGGVSQVSIRLCRANVAGRSFEIKP
jgi:hypothetical protein